MTRGIIASASHEARKLGARTPMPMERALRICPGLILVRGDFEKCELFPRGMFSCAQDLTPEVEATGIDEGRFDLTRAVAAGHLRAGRFGEAFRIPDCRVV